MGLPIAFFLYQIQTTIESKRNYAFAFLYLCGCGKKYTDTSAQFTKIDSYWFLLGFFLALAKLTSSILPCARQKKKLLHAAKVSAVSRTEERRLQAIITACTSPCGLWRFYRDLNDKSRNELITDRKTGSAYEPIECGLGRSAAIARWWRIYCVCLERVMREKNEIVQLIDCWWPAWARIRFRAFSSNLRKIPRSNFIPFSSETNNNRSYIFPCLSL